jgi:urease accessory protein
MTSAAASLYDPPALQRAKGELVVTWRDRDGTTALADLRQDGCLKARFPRPTGWAEAVMLNSSGGIAAGDQLRLRLEVGANAKATFTAQAAERFYRARPTDPPATIHTTLSVAEGASAEWLPQETILFDHSALTRTLSIDLAENAWFLGLETLVFGRALMGETVHALRLRDTITLRRAGKLALHDAIRLEGEAAPVLAQRASTNGAIATATIIHAAPDAAARLAPLREAWENTPAQAAASTWNNLLVARLVAPDSATLRLSIVAALAVLREARPLPRVWSC